MYLSVETRANKNSPINVRAQGVPPETNLIAFSASCGDYTDTPPSFGSASWCFSASSEGTVTVTASARDEHGMDLATARATVVIVDPYKPRRGTLDLSAHSRNIQARTDAALNRRKKP